LKGCVSDCSKRLAAAALCAALAACTAQSTKTTALDSPGLGVPASPRVVADNEPVPRGGGRYQVGRAYQVAGSWYIPKEDPHYDRVGVASWYGSDFHGRLTANGEVFDRMGLMAANPTMPLPSYARVTNLSNHRSVIVRVNDRGPYARSRLMDVSERTADLLDFKHNGMAVVRVQYVGRAPLQGDDTSYLMASYRAQDRGIDSRAGVMLASAPDLPKRSKTMPPIMLAANRGQDGNTGPRAGVMPASAIDPPKRSKTMPPIVIAANRLPTPVQAPRPVHAATAEIAYAGSGSGAAKPVQAATSALTGSFSADDRIFMAFQTVGDAQ
jgi:rare lipoprotein A